MSTPKKQDNASFIPTTEEERAAKAAEIDEIFKTISAEEDEDEDSNKFHEAQQEELQNPQQPANAKKNKKGKKFQLSKTGQFLLANGILLLVQIVFGFFYVGSKVALKEVNPAVFSTFRAILTFFTVLPLCLIVDRNHKFDNNYFASKKQLTERYPMLDKLILSKIPPWKDFVLMASIGILMIPANQLFFAAGLQFSTAATASVFQPLITVFTSIVAVMLRFEKVTILKTIGVLLSVVGAVATVISNNASKMSQDAHSTGPLAGMGFTVFGFHITYTSLIASGLFIANTLSVGVFNNLQAVGLRKGIPAMTITFWSYLTGMVVTVAISVYFFIGFNPLAVSWQAWLGIIFAGTAGGSFNFTLLLIATKLSSPLLTGLYSCLLPVGASLLGFLVLGENLNLFLFAGAAVILTGVFLVILAKFLEFRKDQKLASQKSQEAVNQELEQINDAFGELDEGQGGAATGGNSSGMFGEEEEDESANDNLLNRVTTPSRV